MTIRILAVGAAALLASCADTNPTNNASSEVCRPEGVAPADLGIGDLLIPHSRVVARLEPDGYTDNYAILITLDEAGSDALAQLTREKLNQPLPLSLDGQVVSAPIVRTPILGGRLQVSGNFTRTAASDIVARLSRSCATAAGNP